MDKSIYKNRRNSLKNKLPKNSALIIPGADLQYRNADSSYALRQESSFYYFSGFSEPSSVMLLINSGEKIESLIFVPEKDKLKEIWDGYRAGPVGAVDEYLFDQGFENNKIDELMPEALQGLEKVFYSIGKKSGFDQKVIDWTCAANSKDRHSNSIDIMDGSSLVGNMRLIKDEHEIDIMKKACDISAESYINVMKSIKPGDNEQGVEALFLYEFAKRGGRFPAYTPIVAGGESACVLHYIENDKDLKGSDLILVDAGCEYQMYASDITRTFPVGGKFSTEQLEIYNVVLKANLAAIDAVKTGNSIMEPQLISEKVITEGLVELGILSGDVDTLHKKGAFRDFYMHKIGHWLGMDVHDVGDYMEDDDFMKFKPGMVTTIEPGIYISSTMDVDDKWKGIGIRIEDDILVTESGNLNLTAKVPSNPQEIEALMA
ncbi:aminopeptidase P N-terminal domain-containing protein [Gammaproteobacteria bacterium]|nr:aminopeptidase P N-terminal domain-containing protein [Gammaproteobacteria bacterium]MDA7844633.1 aminopeptidase P N-terminal domain-containing protein [Gammaproteobacteria bacterium]